MKEEPLFRIWDTKYKKWAFVRADNGRTAEQYWREKIFKESGLMRFDLEGFMLDEYGSPCLADECGNFMYLPKRFQVCFSKQKIAEMEYSPSGNYKKI